MTTPPPVLEAVPLASLLQSGQAAVIPTDTVVGLAVRPEEACQIWTLKRRPADKPLILMGGDVDGLLGFAEERCHADARSLAERHWPGALTLVLPARGRVVDLLNPGGGSLGIRIPACGPTRELLRLVGPLATSSVRGRGGRHVSKRAATWTPTLAQAVRASEHGGELVRRRVLAGLTTGCCDAFRTVLMRDHPHRPLPSVHDSSPLGDQTSGGFAHAVSGASVHRWCWPSAAGVDLRDLNRGEAAGLMSKAG